MNLSPDAATSHGAAVDGVLSPRWFPFSPLDIESDERQRNEPNYKSAAGSIKVVCLMPGIKHLVIFQIDNGTLLRQTAGQPASQPAGRSTDRPTDRRVDERFPFFFSI